MSELLFHSLLGGSVATLERGGDRYRHGLRSSYVQRANASMVGAGALLKRDGVPGWAGSIRGQLELASELLFKAVRVWLGLSPSRERDLLVLMVGRSRSESITGIERRARLQRIVACSVAPAMTAELAARWLTELRTLADELARSPAPRTVRRRRATPRPLRSPT